MHIIIGVLGSMITILILLNRLAQAGLDFAMLNPFLWRRRRQWRKKYDGDPVFKIGAPMDATAVLMVCAAKADGDMTKEDKSLLLNLFEKEFKLSKKEAASLLISSAHLLGDGNEVRNKLKQFLSPSIERFTEAQASSAMSLLRNVAGSNGSVHPNTESLISQVEQAFEKRFVRNEQW